MSRPESLLTRVLLTLFCGYATAVAPPGTEGRVLEVLKTAQVQGFAGEVLIADADSVWFERAVGATNAPGQLQTIAGDRYAP